MENFTHRRRAIIRYVHPSRARTVFHERVVFVFVFVVVSAFRETGFAVETIAKKLYTADESNERIVIDGRRRR